MSKNSLKYDRFEVKIPYGLNGDLATAYNQAIESANTEWVLLLDHDVFVSCNPYWYDICLNAINKAPDKAALLTCVTSFLSFFKGPRRKFPQTSYYQEKSDIIGRHIRTAELVWRKHTTTLTKIETHTVAGFFMLVKKSVWEKIKFRDAGKGVAEIDWDYCKRLLKNGYEMYEMTGLYVYHRREIRKIKWKVYEKHFKNTLL